MVTPAEAMGDLLKGKAAILSTEIHGQLPGDRHIPCATATRQSSGRQPTCLRHDSADELRSHRGARSIEQAQRGGRNGSREARRGIRVSPSVHGVRVNAGQGAFECSPAADHVLCQERGDLIGNYQPTIAAFLQENPATQIECRWGDVSQNPTFKAVPETAFDIRDLLGGPVRRQDDGRSALMEDCEYLQQRLLGGRVPCQEVYVVQDQDGGLLDI